jgi:hypothetical protein
MDHLTFVPGGNEFFLRGGDAGDADQGAAPRIISRLRRAGWPSAARIVGGPDDGQHLEGTLVELIDALPILAAADEHGLSPSVTLYAAVARRGLQAVAEGRLVPVLRPRKAPHDPRPTGWEARWMALPVQISPGDPSDQPALHKVAPEVAVVLGRLVSVRQLSTHDTGWLLRRVLDACADVLVREAAWRGAVVRLAGWPADAWEQRLVHALCDPHPVFSTAAPRPPDEQDPAELAKELSEWTRVQAEGASLLPSPPSWRAPEPLLHVLKRIAAPAAQLAERLLQSKEAPRTLPVPSAKAS